MYVPGVPGIYSTSVVVYNSNSFLMPMVGRLAAWFTWLHVYVCSFTFKPLSTRRHPVPSAPSVRADSSSY